MKYKKIPTFGTITDKKNIISDLYENHGAPCANYENKDISKNCKDMSKKIVPYQYRLHDAGGSTEKRWYIEYYDDAGKRFRIYQRLNDSLSTTIRRQIADVMIRELNENRNFSADWLVNLELALYNRSISERSKGDYRSKVRCLKDFSAKNNVKTMTADIAALYPTYLRQCGLADTTINDHIILLRSGFKSLLKQGKWKGLNPFEAVDLFNAEATPAKYFSSSQVALLKEELSKNETLWVFVQMIFYCYIRPKEIRFLKVADVNIDEATIRLKSNITKNRKLGVVTIPRVFQSTLSLYIKGKKPGEWLFPSARDFSKPISRNHMINKHQDILKELGYDTSEYCLYSWKHTGVVMAVKANISLKYLQLQLRHSSLDMVNKYLRQLGITDLSEFADRMPSI